MLRELHVQNLAIIDELKIDFGSGLNVMSGETGAGKSIVIDAIQLILGGRADQEMIRAGCDTASVEASFEISGMTDIQQRLEERGIEYEVQEPLVIRRILSRVGKNRVHLNGQLANLSILHEICSGLVDISSQHEFHKLMNPAFHVRIIDAYGGLTEMRKLYQSKLKAMHELLTQIKELSMNDNERARQADYLDYQIQEIENVNPRAEEDVELENDRRKLVASKDILQFISGAVQTLSENENALVEQLTQILDRCTDFTGVDAAFDPARRCFEAGLIQVEEGLRELRSLAKNRDFDPAQLEEMESRLSDIKSIMRKYGPTVNDVHAFLEKARYQRKQLDEREETLQKLQADLQAIREEALELGLELSSRRKKIVDVFSDSVREELVDLGLEHARLVAVFEPLEAKRKFASDGIDRVHFDVAMNPGEPPSDLAKFASGGELSRILLAIKNVIAGRGEISVYLFDEVDSGIGGRVALQVGQKLASVAQHNQVICITHLAQVASFADHHFLVEKHTLDGRTLTNVRPLDPEDQTHEIIRMIGGDSESDSALRHAEDLLRSAQQRRLELRRRESVSHSSPG